MTSTDSLKRYPKVQRVSHQLSKNTFSDLNKRTKSHTMDPGEERSDDHES